MQNLFRRLLFHYWYFRQPPWDTGVSPPELLEFIREHKAGRAIDLGCGTGTNVVTLARSGWQVTGVDFAPRAIKLASQKVAQAGVQAELSIRDATKLDGIDGPFDFAFDLGCFHTISQDGRNQYLEQLDRILAPNGFWLMYGFLNPDASRAGPGLDEADLSRISARLTLLSRRDGFDDKGARLSAWFLFQKEEYV
ncbi:MAG TPA: class I SAM-dependent methyltransferase [Anaerolineales bacterium]|nr:class I SAM-dependent methyltransferase [Anaerolineales bacterium]